MRAAAPAASIGYSPIAVSPESMIASAPSSTAFATSLASARVGRGAWIIDSSIWVATIAGFPTVRAARSISFLKDRDLLHRELHSEVAAGDHQGVGVLEDRVDVLHGRPGLNLRDDRYLALSHQRAETDHVGGTANEGLRDQIDAELEGARQPVAIARSDRGQVQPFGGNVHPRAGAQGSASDDLR